MSKGLMKCINCPNDRCVFMAAQGAEYTYWRCNDCGTFFAQKVYVEKWEVPELSVERIMRDQHMMRIQHRAKKGEKQ